MVRSQNLFLCSGIVEGEQPNDETQAWSPSWKFPCSVTGTQSPLTRAFPLFNKTVAIDVDSRLDE